ncbi:MAG: AAA family ATPase [Promethearchaeota archaeon]
MQAPKQICIILCGLPASGKSTLSAELQRVLSRQHDFHFDVDMEIVDVDEIRGVDYRGGRGKDCSIFKPELEGAIRRKKLEAIGSYLNEGKSIVDDDMNYFRSMRKETIMICVKSQVPYAIIHVSTPLPTCIKWNQSRGIESVPRIVLERVNENFDLPGSRAYRWDAPLLTVDPSEENMQHARTRIKEVLKNRLKRIERTMQYGHIPNDPAFFNLACTAEFKNVIGEKKALTQTKSNSNILDEFDLATRRVTGECIKLQGHLSRETIGKIKAFKRESRKILKKNPASIDELVDKFVKLLNGT